MDRVVVDTDVASYIFNSRSSAQRYVGALHGFDLVLSFMSVAEMRNGAFAARWGDRRRNQLEQFIKRFGILNSNDNSCTGWARVRAEAKASGRALSPQDAWIAATALDIGAPLATNNRSDFENIQKLRLFSM
jgi:tRNA(fMet)-specific endonuclease VapC